MLDLFKFVPEVRNWLDRTRQRKDIASASLRHAITESQIYLGEYERKSERDYKVEADLARAWSAASRDTRSIDTVLSDACYEFSRFWASGDDFSGLSALSLLCVLQAVYRQGQKFSLLTELLIPPNEKD